MKIKDMCKYRDVWMGIAMLWIISFHSGLHFSNPIMAYLKTIGYGGVDIFIFAAGFGNYCSYLRDNSPLDYLKRRVIRLAPVYVPFILGWMVYNLSKNIMNPFSIIGNLLGIQGFSSSGYEFNWFLTAIIICYLLTPYLASYINQNSIVKNIFLVIFTVLVSVAFWNDIRFIISVTRIPIYVIGMIFAKYKEKVITKKMVALLICLFALGSIALRFAYVYAYDYLWNYGLWWYPFILVVPFLCYFVSYISMLLVQNRIGEKVVNIFSAIGCYSFELFLIHIFMFDLVISWLSDMDIDGSNAIWCIAIILVIPCVIVLRIVSSLIVRYLYQRSE